MPWSFSFYGQSYSRITADTNGNVWFGGTGSANSFNLAATGNGPVIAAWNNDLSSYYSGGVFVQHKANPERVVIEWRTETYTDEGDGRPNIFAVVLFPNGSIRTDYGTFTPSTGKDFGSGISKGNGTSSLSLSSAYGNVYSLPGRSFLFARGTNIYVGNLAENFGNVPTGTTSSPHSLTVFNGGTDSSRVNSVKLTANTSGMFSIVTGSDNCSGTTLTPSRSCTVQTVFSPTTVGPQSAVLEISSDDSTTRPVDVTMNGSGLQPTLTVAKVDIGAGTVTSYPAGISCGTVCSASFATGSAVTLLASPEVGSSFTGWSGACSGTGNCSLTIGAELSVAASFTPATPPSVMIVAPTGSIASKTPVLQYRADAGTSTVKVDGLVVDKTSGDVLDPLSEGAHLIRVETTNKAGYTGFAESPVIVDTIPPAVVSVVPGAGASNVPTNASIVFTFNKPIDAASFLKGCITLSSSAGPVPGIATVSHDAMAVTFKPLVQLAYNCNYTAKLAGRVVDFTGNAAVINSTLTFETMIAGPDLVGLWSMDGDWSDSSGNGWAGTANGGAAFSTDRTNGTMAGSFLATSDYVSIGNLYGRFPNNTFTIESWVKLADTGDGGSRTIAGVTGSWADYSIGLSNNKFVAFVSDGQPNSSGYSAYSDDTPQVGKWYHVAGTFDGNMLKLYVDGVLQSAISATWRQSNGGADFRIGSANCCGGNNVNGLIDDVAVYNRALTDQEILDDFNKVPKVTLISLDRTTAYNAGETGTAVVTVSHPVGVKNLFCTVDGAASGALSVDFDSTRTLVTQLFTFHISPIAMPNASATITCSGIDDSGNVGSAILGLTVTAVEVPIHRVEPGDCDGDGSVTISEVQSAINMFLGREALAGCVDLDNLGTVSIAEMQKVINAFLELGRDDP